MSSTSFQKTSKFSSQFTLRMTSRLLLLALTCCHLCIVLHTEASFVLEYPSSSSQLPDLKTVLDLRGDVVYKYRGNDHLATTLPLNNSMEIQFDLKLQFVNKDTPFLEKIPILFFESNTVKMTIYLNERGQFGIMHYHRDLDRSGYWKRLLLTNMFFIPAQAAVPIIGNPAAFQHYTIQMINNDSILLVINGYVIKQKIDRELWPAGEVMNVWMDRKGFKVKGFIYALVIKAQ